MLSTHIRMKQNWCMSKQIFHRLYPAILYIDKGLVTKMGFICLKNIPWLFTVHKIFPRIVQTVNKISEHKFLKMSTGYFQQDKITLIINK